METTAADLSALVVRRCEINLQSSGWTVHLAPALTVGESVGVLESAEDPGAAECLLSYLPDGAPGPAGLFWSGGGPGSNELESHGGRGPADVTIGGRGAAELSCDVLLSAGVPRELILSCQVSL